MVVRYINELEANDANGWTQHPHTKLGYIDLREIHRRPVFMLEERLDRLPIIAKVCRQSLLLLQQCKEGSHPTTLGCQQSLPWTI